MKKVLLVVVVVAVMLTASIAAFAEEEVATTNMDKDTFLELRLGQIEQALKDEKITQEQADLLKAHITERAAEGTFGLGPNNGEGNDSCILGENGNLGIFRNANAGKGSGNGQGYKRGNGGRGLRNGSCLTD